MGFGAFVVAFCAGAVLDFFWGMYVLAVAQKKKAKAASASVLCALPAMLGITLYMDNRWLAVPYCLGLFFGTWIYLTARELNSEGE